MATGDLFQTDIQSLRQTVAALEQRLATVESQLPGELAKQPLCIDPWRDDVVRITKELFPGEVTIKLMNDPKYPADWFHVVEAEASGEPHAVVQRQIEWHRRMREVSPELRDLAISLAVPE